MRRLPIFFAAALLGVSSIAQGYSTLGTKWDMGPNLATHLAGHEGTPGVVSWSIMPADLPILVPEDGHAGSLTGSVGSMMGGATLDEEATAFFLAFSTWVSVCNLTAIPVTDGGVGGGALEAVGGHLGDIRLGLITPFESASVLAHAYLPGTEALYGPGGTLTGDVHFNSAKTWVDDPLDPDDGALYDLQTVALHEIGHALGLGHSDVPGSVMFAAYEGGKRGLSPDDIAGIQFIYGPRPVPEPASLAALGVGAVWLLRKRRA